jgi:hypothetical protein
MVMLVCRHSIFLLALRIALQSGNSSAMATCDHIDIAVVIPTNAHRMIVPMFVTSSGLRVTPYPETETSDPCHKRPPARMPISVYRENNPDLRKFFIAIETFWPGSPKMKEG